jgi:hypothetical protein
MLFRSGHSYVRLKFSWLEKSHYFRKAWARTYGWNPTVCVCVWGGGRRGQRVLPDSQATSTVTHRWSSPYIGGNKSDFLLYEPCEASMALPDTTHPSCHFIKTEPCKWRSPVIHWWLPWYRNLYSGDHHGCPWIKISAWRKNKNYESEKFHKICWQFIVNKSEVTWKGFVSWNTEQSKIWLSNL